MRSDALRYTVEEMYRLADRYAGDLAGYGVQRFNVSELFDFIRRIPYVADHRLCPGPECLQRPALALSGGDCDDKTIVSGAAFNLRGDPWRIKTVSFSPDGEMQHTYPEVQIAGSWKPFDATYHTNELFSEPDHTRSITWRHPPMKTKTFPGGYSVHSLEGGATSLGLAPALLVESAGILAKIDSILEKLPLIGSLFRGSTPHVSEDDAVMAQRAAGNEAVKLYNSLDATGRQLMYDLSRSFFMNHILPGWGGWWDNLIANDYATWTTPAKNFLKDQPTSVYHWLSMPIYYFARNEDLTRLPDSMEAWYNAPVKRMVYDPISQYLSQKYNVSLDEVREAGGIQEAGIASSSTSGSLGLIAIAGLGILALTAGKRSRRGG